MTANRTTGTTTAEPVEDLDPAVPATGAVASAANARTTAESLEDSYQRVITQVLPSVVEIRTGTGPGSGVVLDADGDGDGDIVTNAHVVGDATTFQVQFADSATSYPASLVGTYPPSDVAVIRVDGAPELHPATLGDSDGVEVGTLVPARGNPLGLSSSMTNGIVSAVGRTVSEPSRGSSPGATLPGTIQPSAAIDPADSGGALVDLDGEVTDTDRAALGVTVTTVADADGQAAGVGVVSVEVGGGAEAGGIRAGDVITSVDGQEVRTTAGSSAVLAALEVGRTVEVGVVRDGEERTFSVDLTELPA